MLLIKTQESWGYTIVKVILILLNILERFNIDCIVAHSRVNYYYLSGFRSLDYVIEHIFEDLGVSLEIVSFKTDFSDIQNGLKLTPPIINQNAL